MSETFDPAAFRAQVGHVLDEHARAFSVPPDRHALLRRQIEGGDDIHSRRTFPGHITTSAFILDGEGRRVLLIHHRSLARWLQPGGHYEAPEGLAESALREALEETGVQGLALDPWHRDFGIPIDIDSHLIPARPQKGEPEHWHHDIRYIVRAREGDMRPDLSEVHGAEWRDVSELETIAGRALRNLRKLGLVRP
jgi:8-oxo-dGTP pyrophosphatase MutT (NUDIX family)